jgi:CBS domain-containing protein
MTYTRLHPPVRTSDPVGVLMNWPVVSVDADESLIEVSRALAADELGAVLVLHHGVLVGVVSERDIAGHVGAGSDPSRLTAGEVMSQDLVTAPPEAPILEAARIMREAQVRHLPILSEGNLIAGIVSMRDLFEVLLRDAEDRS